MLKSGEYLVAAALLAVHTVVITLPGRAARLAASNVVTNLIRVEALEKAAPPYVVFAGSSMTGRIPEQAATEAAGMTVVNLGLDGCGPADSIKHLLERERLPVMVIIEGNTINSIGEDNSRTVREQFTGVGAWLHASVPFMRYRERPVDVLYSWLRYRSLPSGESAAETLAVPAAVPPPATAPDLPPKLQGDIETLESVARTLQQKGVRLFVFMLPDNQRDRTEQYLAVKWLTAKLAIPMIDLKAPHEASLTYSDAVHLDLASARRIARSIGQWIRNAP